MASLHLQRIWNMALSGIDRVAPRTRLLSRPIRIHISINDLCNLRCPHCLRHTEGVRVNQGALRARELERLEPWFGSAQYVALAGLGEPFLEDDLFETIDKVQRRGATVSIISNGTRIDEAAAERLCGEEPLILNLSVDAATPEVFERVRLGAKFDEVTANIDRLARIKRERGTTFPILSINMTLMRDTLGEVEGVIDLAQRWGIAEIVAQPVMYLPGSPDQSQAITNREAQEALRRAEPHARKAGVRLRYQPLGQSLETQEEDLREGYDFGPETAYAHTDKALPGARKYFCPNLWGQMNIEVLGDMTFCCMADFGLLGNVKDTNPARLWNHPKMVALRKRVLSGDVPDDCRRCFALEHFGRRKMLRLWWQDMKHLLRFCATEWRSRLRGK